MIERAAPQIAARWSRGDLYENLIHVLTHTYTQDFTLVTNVCSILIEMHEIYYSKFDVNAARIIM